MSIVLRGLTKRFNQFVALDDVSLSIPPGEIHALLGANGSGKSTLVKLMTGALIPDKGNIIIGGRDVSNSWSPSQARQSGVSVVYQEAPLLDSLSIAESVAIFSKYPRSTVGNIKWRSLYSATQKMLEELGIERSSKDLSVNLTGAERALLALEIAVQTASNNLKLLVLDEATASLLHEDAQPFLNRLKKIASNGVPILIVTHRLQELKFADKVTVLHEGKIHLQKASSDVKNEEVLSIMNSNSNREIMRDNLTVLSDFWKKNAPENEQSAPSLEVSGLRGIEIQDINFELMPGEVLGFIGPRGGGLDELPRLLSGAESVKSGAIKSFGKLLPKRLNPRITLEFGIAYLPADRLHEGGIRVFDIQDNLILTNFYEFWHKVKSKRAMAQLAINYLNIKPNNYRALFGNLSGGNQQKVILARLLRLRPKVLLLADPTYGVDPAARQVIFQAVRDAKKYGISVLLTTTEPEQMIDICDRVAVINSGKISEFLSSNELTIDILMAKGI